MEMLSLMKWPLIASLILPWLLVYLGLHIVQRGVIFVDLALADKTTGAQQRTLLSALKAKLLANRTFLPEPVEKSFRALCRNFGFDLNMVK